MIKSDEGKHQLACRRCGASLGKGAVVRLESGGRAVHVRCPHVHQPRDTEYRQDVVRLLLYEVREFEKHAWRSIDPRLDGDNDYNARVEAFLTHTRNLIDFLFLGSSASETDVIAEDLFRSANDWRSRRGKAGRVLGDAKQRIGKLLAHMTTERLRLTDDDKTFYPSTIRDEIRRALDTLVDLLPNDEVRETLQAGMLAIRDCVPKRAVVLGNQIRATTSSS